MIAILSPAMNMVQAQSDHILTTKPRFEDKAAWLAKILGGYSAWELESLLGVNSQLAFKAWEYYQDFGSKSAKSPAMLSFSGLAYQNLNPQDFNKADCDFTVNHLRILSSIYGLLLPSDIINPYRLDFMCRFAKHKIDGKKLYDFWGDAVCRELFKHGDTVINLCSAEYEKLITSHLTAKDKLVSCRFLVRKPSGLKCQATASKMARGQMARFIIKNRINRVDQLEAFDWDGFEFMPQVSSEDELVFVQ